MILVPKKLSDSKSIAVACNVYWTTKHKLVKAYVYGRILQDWPTQKTFEVV